ncbi:hypothetical protein C6Y40_18670 [Alteromonas alba]|uniref:Uncharacterized protein n=1 Tax=Alteromonas alba TaxID=2079529 RepID=A0A2S9V6W9_9ALTE|nr:hypothetical protein [Alteromonas alba]PRO72201.1 hypothetical protein C6Y40_18670 [Alteromonas alba]
MMRYLLVIVPIIMGCVELSSRESTGMGWLLIGIGVFFLLARFTGLFTQAQADNANFDWFSGFVFLFFAVMAFKEYSMGYQQNDLLRGIGFTLFGLSTVDVMVARVLAKANLTSLQAVKRVISSRFQTALRFTGLGFCGASLVVALS